jgi:hypothetical protein
MSSFYPQQPNLDFVLEHLFIVNSENTTTCRQGHLTGHRNQGTFAASTNPTNLKKHAKKCFIVSFLEKKNVGTLIQE